MDCLYSNRSLYQLSCRRTFFANRKLSKSQFTLTTQIACCCSRQPCRIDSDSAGDIRVSISSIQAGSIAHCLADCSGDLNVPALPAVIHLCHLPSPGDSGPDYHPPQPTLSLRSQRLDTARTWHCRSSVSITPQI